MSRCGPSLLPLGGQSIELGERLLHGRVAALQLGSHIPIDNREGLIVAPTGGPSSSGKATRKAPACKCRSRREGGDRGGDAPRGSPRRLRSEPARRGRSSARARCPLVEQFYTESRVPSSAISLPRGPRGLGVSGGGRPWRAGLRGTPRVNAAAVVLEHRPHPASVTLTWSRLIGPAHPAGDPLDPPSNPAARVHLPAGAVHDAPAQAAGAAVSRHATTAEPEGRFFANLSWDSSSGGSDPGPERRGTPRIPIVPHGPKTGAREQGHQCRKVIRLPAWRPRSRPRGRSAGAS